MMSSSFSKNGRLALTMSQCVQVRGTNSQGHILLDSLHFNIIYLNEGAMFATEGRPISFVVKLMHTFTRCGSLFALGHN